MLTPKSKHYYCVFCNLQLWTKSGMKRIFCPPLSISCKHHSLASFQTLSGKGCVTRHGFCQHKGWINSQEFSLQLWRTYPNAGTLPFPWYVLRNTSVSRCEHKAKHGEFKSRYGLCASQLRGQWNVLSRKVWKPPQRLGKSQLRHTRISN